MSLEAWATAIHPPINGNKKRRKEKDMEAFAMNTHCEKPQNIIIDPAWLDWQDGAIPAMVDAMMFEECSGCENGKVRSDDGWGVRDNCPNCKGTQRIPRTEPRWSDMLVIADALESAGCSEPAILEHLRSERDGEWCPWCGGEGLILDPYFQSLNPLGSCSHCHGTGRIKRRHYKGCWALELLSRQSSGTGERV